MRSSTVHDKWPSELWFERRYNTVAMPSVFWSLALAAAMPLWAADEETHWRNVWRTSEISLVMWTAMDTYTSYGGREANPLLGRGKFGATQISIKFGGIGLMLAAQHFLHHRRPQTAKYWAQVNMCTSVFLDVTAIHNQSVQHAH